MLPWVLYLELLSMSSHPAWWDQGPIFKTQLEAEVGPFKPIETWSH